MWCLRSSQPGKARKAPPSRSPAAPSTWKNLHPALSSAPRSDRGTPWRRRSPGFRVPSGTRITCNRLMLVAMVELLVLTRWLTVLVLTCCYLFLLVVTCCYLLLLLMIFDWFSMFPALPLHSWLEQARPTWYQHSHRRKPAGNSGPNFLMFSVCVPMSQLIIQINHPHYQE